jgi:hypothetical protein
VLLHILTRGKSASQGHNGTEQSKAPSPPVE